MATMLSGAAVMDAALLLIAGNEPCPQPQTSEHLAAIEIMKLRHMIVLQNKVDLIQESAAEEQYQTIQAFVKGTVADSAPIVPVSAQLRYNIDAVNEYLVKKIPVPLRDFSADPRLTVIRSFDVNKPGAEIDDLKGGVAGGTLFQGVLRVRPLRPLHLSPNSRSGSSDKRSRSDRASSQRTPTARSTASRSGAGSSPCSPNATRSNSPSPAGSSASAPVRPPSLLQHDATDF